MVSFRLEKPPNLPMKQLTSTIALIIRLAGGASTSFAVHGLTALLLLLLSPQTNGVLDALHGSRQSVQVGW